MDNTQKQMKLWQLRQGAVFVTEGGTYAVKSEYNYPNGDCMCVLLESGEFAHFAQHNETLVREVFILGISDRLEADLTA